MIGAAEHGLGVTMWNEIMLFAPNPSAVETLRAWLRSRNGPDVEHGGVHVETGAGPVEMVLSNFWSSYEDWERSKLKRSVRRQSRTFSYISMMSWLASS